MCPGLRLEVEISDQAASSIRSLAQASADGLETGGLLLGQNATASRGPVVVEAGDAGPNADRREGFFLRDLEHAQWLGREAYERAGLQWVGEWHTHPNGDPRPSAYDLSTYASLLADPELDFAVFVSIIVTPDDSAGWAEGRLATWVLATGGNRPG